MKFNTFCVLSSLLYTTLATGGPFKLKVGSSNETVDGSYLVPLDQGDNFYVAYAIKDDDKPAEYWLKDGKLIWDNKGDNVSALITELAKEYNSFFQFNTTKGANVSDEFSFSDDGGLQFDHISGKFLVCADDKLTDYLPKQHHLPAVINYYPTGPGHDFCNGASITKEEV